LLRPGFSDGRLQGRRQVIDCKWQSERIWRRTNGSFHDHKRKEKTMAEIRWEKELSAAQERAKAEKKPIYLDFWFDG
jgi:hypothetical protein